MSEIETNVNRHSKKISTLKIIRIDLTPMVDLGFLLITFFIFTTILSQSAITRLIMPKDTGLPTPVGKESVLTLMLIRNDSIKYYEGDFPKEELMKYCSFNTLRFVLQQKQKKVAETLGDSKKTIVIIYPGNESTFKNFVDVLDEIQINDIRHYFVMNQN